MNLFFDPNLNADSSEVFIDRCEIKHIERVLRKTKGDFLKFTNGKGLEALVEICSNRNDFNLQSKRCHSSHDQKSNILT